MIDMKCPSCGAGGRIPREKVNTRLVCKKCLRVFHESEWNQRAGRAGSPRPLAPPASPPPSQPLLALPLDTLTPSIGSMM